MEFKKFYNYMISEDGHVYSLFSNKYLSGDLTCHGYIQYTLYINGKAKRYRAHQLVALCFIDNPDNKECINHIDGNKLNNHYSNLEWCTYYENNKHARDNKLNDVSQSNHNRWIDRDFRLKTSRSISLGIKRSGCSKGTNNPRFKYLIIDKYGNRYSRDRLAKIIKKSQSYTDSLIARHAKSNNVEQFENFYIITVDKPLNHL